ncbi:MAG: phosphate ABC transporter substrate-binding protein PstS [Chloroflexota bacterium]|nr:phosphate ABC transporter substrate-binding protein PstS [Chloroflexota bacterium]
MLKLSGITTTKWVSLFIIGLVGATLLAACGNNLGSNITPTALPTAFVTTAPFPATPLPNYSPGLFGTTSVTAELTGSGSTFAEPVYTKWFAAYKNIAPNVKLNYQAIGSGSGRSVFLGTPVTIANSTIKPTTPSDFAGSDAAFTGSQLATAVSGVNSKVSSEIVHIPTVVGGVTVSYRLDSYNRELRLSGSTLARIFLGDIKDWSHSDITRDNGAALPSKPIVVVVRSRTSSGTSEIFTRYLSAVDATFRDKVGPSSSPNWPDLKQVQGESNEEVAAKIKAQDGTIGYVDQGAAEQNGLSYASIRNQSGRYIRPTIDSVTAAAEGASIPDDFRTFVVNGEGANVYPIAGFTWLIVWKDFSRIPNPSPEKAQALANFLWWAINDGQRPENLPSGYAPLPASLLPRLQSHFVNSDPSKVFQFEGKPLFQAPK